MALAFHDGTKTLHTSADPNDPRFVGFLIASRTVNADALADMRALMGAGVLPRHWKRSGDRVLEMTAEEKAAADAAAETERETRRQKRQAARADVVAAVAAMRAKAPATRTLAEQMLLGLVELGVFTE